MIINTIYIIIIIMDILIRVKKLCYYYYKHLNKLKEKPNQINNFIVSQ